MAFLSSKKSQTFFLKIIIFFTFSFSQELRISFIKEQDSYFCDRYPFIEKCSNYLTIEILLGTPPQKIKVNLEFFSNNLWILDPRCQDLSLSKTSPPFQTDKSSSLHGVVGGSLQEFKSKHYVQANQVKDTVTISSKKMNNVDFYLAKRFTDLSINTGVLGLDLNNEKLYCEKGINSFLSQLKTNGIIENKVFYFDYTGEKSGELVIGEVPKEKGLKYIEKSVHDNSWSLKTDKIIYGKTIFEREQILKFKIELGIILGPNSYYDFILKNALEHYILTNKCELKDVLGFPYEHFICKKEKINEIIESFPNLEFIVNGKSIIFTGKEMFFETKYNEYGLIVYFPKFHFSNEEEWILGEPFFKKEKLIFNVDNKKIGIFYHIENLSDIFLYTCRWIIVLFITMGLIVFILYSKCYRNKRIKRKKKMNQSLLLVPNV